jgi:hypothetical protein
MASNGGKGDRKQKNQTIKPDRIWEEKANQKRNKVQTKHEQIKDKAIAEHRAIKNLCRKQEKHGCGRRQQI